MSAQRPTLHLTNFSSRKLHKGTVYSIMAAPREWEHGAGLVEELVPILSDLRAVKRGEIDISEYQDRFIAGTELEDVRPGYLGKAGKVPVEVKDGDTLCCACSKEEAKAGRCHRVWSALFLYQAGWNVVLDGELYEPPPGLPPYEQ